MESQYADKASILNAAGIEIVERDRDAIEAIIHTAAGPVTFVASLTVIENRLILDEVHVSGEGLTLTRIRQVAKVLGEIEDERVMEIIIQGAHEAQVLVQEAFPAPSG